MSQDKYHKSHMTRVPKQDPSDAIQKQTTEDITWTLKDQLTT